MRPSTTQGGMFLPFSPVFWVGQPPQKSHLPILIIGSFTDNGGRGGLMGRCDAVYWLTNTCQICIEDWNNGVE